MALVVPIGPWRCGAGPPGILKSRQSSGWRGRAPRRHCVWRRSAQSRVHREPQAFVAVGGCRFVKPALRGQGIGLELLRALEAHAQMLNFSHIYCGTNGAATLLQRANWRHMEQITHQGKALSIYEKALSTRRSTGRAFGAPVSLSVRRRNNSANLKNGETAQTLVACGNCGRHFRSHFSVVGHTDCLVGRLPWPRC